MYKYKIFNIHVFKIFAVAYYNYTPTTHNITVSYLVVSQLNTGSD